MTPARILFVAPVGADYLAITLLNGLRTLLGSHVIDYPKYELAYRSYPEIARARVYGRGFTAFFTLGEIPVARENVEAEVKNGYYDLIVFGCIWSQFELFTRWQKWLSPHNTLICDGADSAQVYPHAGKWWRRPSCWFLPRATRGYLYFKREWTEESQFRIWHRLVPTCWWKHFSQYKGLRRISFSIPAEKIIKTSPPKTKDFPRHIVDQELARYISGGITTYAFASEAEYYADLQLSRFGITTKRLGWDCMRHYEIAANGAVPCFRDLQLKPANCAPHGLIPGKNCLSYLTAADLFQQVEDLDDNQYLRLQKGALDWVQTKSTEMIASEILAEWRKAQPSVFCSGLPEGTRVPSGAFRLFG